MNLFHPCIIWCLLPLLFFIDEPVHACLSNIYSDMRASYHFTTDWGLSWVHWDENTPNFPQAPAPQNDRMVLRRSRTRRIGGPMAADPMGFGLSRSANLESRIERRIVGGVNVTKHNPIPYQLSLRRRISPYLTKHICGAVLIEKAMALTVAHCFPYTHRREPQNYILVGGSFNLNHPDDTEQIRMVEKIRIHPEYRNDSLENDIAILHLREEFELNRHIYPIQMSWDDTKSFEGYNATASGWGQTKFGGPVSETLLKVDLPIMSQQKCQERWSSLWNPHYVGDKVICAGGHWGKDSCRGDSGTPLALTQLGPTCRHVLVGIMSWGHSNCGQNNLPGVYTRVTKYTAWIREVIQRRDFFTETNLLNNILEGIHSNWTLCRPFFSLVGFPPYMTTDHLVRAVLTIQNHLGHQLPVNVTVSKNGRNDFAFELDWNKDLDMLSSQLVVDPYASSNVTFFIRAKKLGRHTLQFKAQTALGMETVSPTIWMVTEEERKTLMAPPTSGLYDFKVTINTTIPEADSPNHQLLKICTTPLYHGGGAYNYVVANIIYKTDYYTFATEDETPVSMSENIGQLKLKLPNKMKVSYLFSPSQNTQSCFQIPIKKLRQPDQGFSTSYGTIYIFLLFENQGFRWIQYVQDPKGVQHNISGVDPFPW